MNRWILQMGYPVVTVNTQTGSISQQHFLIDSEAKVDSLSPYKYVYTQVSVVKTALFAPSQVYLYVFAMSQLRMVRAHHMDEERS